MSLPRFPAYVFFSIPAGLVFGTLSLLADTSAEDWELIWSDEFSEDGTPDPLKWGYESGFVRNYELQWYQSENAFCEDGLLVIEGRRERIPNPNYVQGSSDWKRSRQYAEYSSASLRTRDTFTWKFGRLEVRARLPIQNGMWPAIWTLGASGEWPSNGECDVLEYYSDHILANCAWGTAARWVAEWDSAKIPYSHFTDQDPDWASKFHTWRMDWDEHFIRLYLDDELLNETDLSQTLNVRSGQPENPFLQDHYLILNLALGSNGGNPAGATFPARYEIDWVRVYQKSSDEVRWEKHDDAAPSITFSDEWGTWAGNPGYLGTEHFSETAGAEATFTFTGNRAQWFGYRRDDLGLAEVYVDGVFQTTIDCYAANAEWGVLLYETPELVETEHTLTVRVTGMANPSASGHEVIVDAFAFRHASEGEPWQRRWFTDQEIVNTPEHTAALSDTDSDGFAAIEEALLGSDPKDPSSQPLIKLDPHGQETVRFSFDRLINRGSTEVLVEISENMFTWTPVENDLETAVPELSSTPKGYERRAIDLPVSSTLEPTFLRHAITEYNPLPLSQR
jgi:beta-glucanase (GH16 family)